MHADLKWLAENVSEWGGTYNFKHIFLEDGGADYSSVPDVVLRTFTRAQWQAAREELIIQRAEQRQRPNIKTQVTAWHAAEDEILASEMSGAEPCPEDPFASPGEDEAWAEAEKRMDAIGHNGGTGDHYAAKSLEERYPQYYKSVRHLEFVDVYQVHNLFAIEDWSGCIQHASKKLLLSGVRTGGKTKRQDVEEARDTLTRWLKVEEGR